MNVDPREHSTAFIDALTTAGVAAFRQGSVPGATGNPGSLPGLFAIVYVERRFVEAVRGSGEDSVTGWRVNVVYVGRTEAEAQWLAMKIYGALDDRLLDIDGEPFGPVKFQLEQAPESDDGRFSGRIEWTY